MHFGRNGLSAETLGSYAMNWRDRHIRLRRLEAEAIYIMREAAAEFENPVMLYSVGKDSSVHAAHRAKGILSGRSLPSRSCTSTRPGNFAK